MSGNNGALQYDLVTGDTGSQFKMVCKDRSTGAVMDLTGCVINLHWLDAADTPVSRAMQIEGDPALGTVSYLFLAGEIFAPEMVFEVEVTNSGGRKLTSNNPIRLRVRRQIA